ncbi:ImmA/IrrE family metallo-endopeptidase [Hyphomonas beringensis]|uniref:ImmA/IrrE family metallo-endopeptidase n=1 Tax=Hyphomonas beringensis TaxID=1280946 RepID=UPI0009DF746B|nr:ImmA/IrrE family metallo-endopeptidase [Hyphomonas beringensis]
MTTTRHRRGFVKEAEEYASEFRRELELGNSDPICPFRLCAHLDITTRPLSFDAGIAEEVKLHFNAEGRDKFSATALFDGVYAEILYNDWHSAARVHSSVMHELAHILLMHPPRPPILESGCRHFDAQMEREANDLGWTILIPKLAALRAIERFPNLKDAAEFYGVSVDLLEYRIRKSDARRWKANRDRRR